MNHRLFVFSSLCLLMAVLARVADGQSWDRFRGPGGSGQCEATTIPTIWSTKDYKWRVKLPGVGHSSPVVRDGKIFVTCGETETAARIIRCLDTSDGGLVWKRSFPSEHHGMNAFNSYGSSTPALDKDRVYMTWATPDEYIVVALDQAKGRELWRRDLGPFQGEHGYGASPIVFEDLLIVTNDQDGESFVIAFDCTSGKTRWKAERLTEVAAYSTPCIFRPEGQPPQLILTSWANGITSLDPRSGNKNWELPILNYRVVCSPAIAGGLIFTSCGSGGGGKQMVAVRPGIPGRGIEAALAYEIEGSLPYVPTSVAHGQLLFLWSDSGVVTCLDAPTGDVHWRERVGGQYFSSPVRVADRIYCISRNGEMVVLAAADKFKLLGRVDLEEPSHATPAIADGVMYLRTESHLMALGGK